MEADSQLNPWLRANLDTFDLETVNLIPEQRRPEYGLIQQEIVMVRSALNELLAKRHDFFHDVSEGKL